MDLKNWQESKRYPSREQVLDLFKYRCPRCRQSAFVVHELEPRSRGEDSMRMDNRCAICFLCHENFHAHGATDLNISDWREDIKKYLIAIGNWEEYSNWDRVNNEQTV